MKWFLIVIGAFSAVAGFFGYKFGKQAYKEKNNKLEVENEALKLNESLLRKAVEIATSRKEQKDFVPEADKADTIDDLADLMNEMIADSKGASK